MTINHSIRDWINYKQPEFAAITSLPVVVMGERLDLNTPYITVHETGQEGTEQNGVFMRGVSAFTVKVELVTVPVAETEEGTDESDRLQMQTDMMNVLGDTDAISWASERNGWRIFDIRGGVPTQESTDGQLISSYDLTVIACPI
jgi:hypothetical protein